MGKKRKRAPVLGAPVEIDPLYFVHPVEPSTESVELPVVEGDRQEEAPPEKQQAKKSRTRGSEDAALALELTEPSDSASPLNPEGSRLKDKPLQSESIADVSIGAEAAEELQYIDETDSVSDTEPVVTDSVVQHDGPSKTRTLPGALGWDENEIIAISDTTFDSDDVVDLTASSPNNPAQPRPQWAHTLSPEKSASPAAEKPLPRAPLTSQKPVALTVNSKVPGKECTKTETWKANAPFYGLDKEFGRDCVLLYEGKELKKFQTPARVCPNSTVLSIEVMTELQWKQVELARFLEVEDEDSRSTSPGTAAEDEQHAAAEPDATAERFPITLEGKHGKERALVSQASVIQDLVNHYLKAKNLAADTPVRVKFDGDLVDPSSTVQDIDMDADDKLEIHI